MGAILMAVVATDALLRAVWTARIRQAVEASVAAHGVPRADLDTLRGQLDALRRELTARTADVEALRQAVYAARSFAEAASSR